MRSAGGGEGTVWNAVVSIQTYLLTRIAVVRIDIETQRIVGANGDVEIVGAVDTGQGRKIVHAIQHSDLNVTHHGTD